MNRRRWVAAAAAAGAAAAGAGWGVWQHRRTEAELAAAALWSMRFERPDGGTLALAGFKGRPLLINFWATWCAPCVKEMPLLDRFARDFAAARGGQVVGLAADNAMPVREFLRRLPVSFAIGLAGFEGIELSRQLGNASGALPFTALYSSTGRLLRGHLGIVKPADLAAWLQTT